MPSLQGGVQGPLPGPGGGGEPQDPRSAGVLKPWAGPISELPAGRNLAHSLLSPRAVPDFALPHRSPPPPEPAAAPEVTRPGPSILCPSAFNQHNLTGCFISLTNLPPDRRAQQPTTGQNWRASHSPSVAASVGGARAASKLSGATADVSQQRSREASGPSRLAAPPG